MFWRNLHCPSGPSKTKACNPRILLQTHSSIACCLSIDGPSICKCPKIQQRLLIQSFQLNHLGSIGYTLAEVPKTQPAKCYQNIPRLLVSVTKLRHFNVPTHLVSLIPSPCTWLPSKPWWHAFVLQSPWPGTWKEIHRDSTSVFGGNKITEKDVSDVSWY